jgi:hypothetical protein
MIIHKNLIFNFFLLASFLVINRQQVFAQKYHFGDDAIKASFAPSILFSNQESGMGLTLGAAYQHNLHQKERLRGNIETKIGYYTRGIITDVGEHCFLAMNLGTWLDFDVVKVKTFSILLSAGTGLAIHKGKSYSGSWGKKSTSNTYPKDIENLRGYLSIGAGFRFQSLNKRRATEFKPINVLFNSGSYDVVYPSLSIDYYFKSKKRN